MVGHMKEDEMSVTKVSVNKKLDGKLTTIAAKISEILERDKVSDAMHEDLHAVRNIINSYRRNGVQSSKAKPIDASTLQNLA
jgi:hypothetical protein